MDALSLPQKNYVGLLNEKCTKNSISAAEFLEDPDKQADKFKCTCLLKGFTTDGFGYTKKMAKQNSAHAMLEKLERENLFQSLGSEKLKNKSICNLYEYCSRERKDVPLFSDKPREDSLYVVTCTFDNFTSTGKGVNKKIAKEMSADLIVKHFKINEYIDNNRKCKERKETIKPPTQCLHEYCQVKRLKCEYTEKNISKDEYVVTCMVGKYEVSSAANSSKKQAKMEAASLMLSLLNSSTPEGSPIPAEERSVSGDGGFKRKLSEDGTSDEEPLIKRVIE